MPVTMMSTRRSTVPSHQARRPFLSRFRSSTTTTHNNTTSPPTLPRSNFGGGLIKGLSRRFFNIKKNRPTAMHPHGRAGQRQRTSRRGSDFVCDTWGTRLSGNSSFTRSDEDEDDGTVCISANVSFGSSAELDGSNVFESSLPSRPGDSVKVRFRCNQQGEILAVRQSYKCQDRTEMYWSMLELDSMMQSARKKGREISLAHRQQQMQQQPREEATDASGQLHQQQHEEHSRYVDSLRYLYKDPVLIASKDTSCTATHTFEAIQMAVQHEGARGLEKLACPQLRSHRSFNLRAILAALEQQKNQDESCSSSRKTMKQVGDVLNQRAIDMAVSMAKGDAAEAQSSWDELKQELLEQDQAQRETQDDTSFTAHAMMTPPVSSSTLGGSAHIINGSFPSPANNTSSGVADLCQQFGRSVYQGLAWDSISWFSLKRQSVVKDLSPLPSA